MKFKLVGLWAALALAGSTTDCFATPIFNSTNNPTGNWFVSTNVNPNGDGQLSSFNTTNFTQAVSVTGRPDFIADTSSGTHGNVGTWTFFVFRQTFDLTGYDATTADLKFQFAADDSGEIILTRGSWIPEFSLNGGAFVNYPGSSNANRIPTYSYSSVVDVSGGFVSGINTIDFYVEGNGLTDGFALTTVSFSANPSNQVPDGGATVTLLGGALLGLATLRRKLARA